jgi:pyruvate dehydrogenase E2 component (dihydrolipoamide acetyltransferase)
MSSPDPSG